jgi:limonene-1,2-epoxide hydrolase
VDGVRTGPGIWKWSHYLDVYERHFSRFRGRTVTIAEIGIYSGGSIAMWRDYFGPECRVIGVDIEESCRVYATEGVEVIIGDQSDPGFWQRFFATHPEVDIVVDDGGHMVHQQVPTIEAVLPHLRPGGVYLCEDVHDRGNDFHFYIAGLLRELNATQTTVDLENPERRVVSRATGFQAAVHSAHFYPYLVVIERREAEVVEFVAPKRGTQWQPFGDAWDELTRPSASEAQPRP